MTHRKLGKKTLALVAGGLMLMSAVASAAPTELTLEESIALALRNNPTMKIAEADRDKYSWAVREAQAGQGPTLSYSHKDARAKAAPSTLVPNPSPVNDFDNTVSLSLPIYSGGRVDGAIGKAEYDFKAADLGLAKTKQQLKLDVTNAYFKMLQTRNLLQVKQESVDNLTAHLRNVQAQYEVGTVAKSDVLRSEVELANAQQSLITAQNDFDLAMASLNNVVGLPLDTEIKLKEEMKYEQSKLTLADGINFAMQYRPDVLQADYALKGAQETVKVARSGFLPTVTLSGANNWTDSKFPGSKNRNWSVYLTTSLTLFDTNLTLSKVKEAEAGVVKANEQYRQTKDSVSLEVRQAYLSMKESEKRIETSQVAVAKADEDFKIAQVRYNAGVGTNLDVIDAELALAQAKTNYIQALYDYNTSKAKLDKAMGVAVKQ
ncbi:TolC family protein [Anaeroselena agilis]|uniref:TolC family protein n=1 Tax=Anaeroselena agilis TaxID=3063788 RepID=A0ABU3P411_9FIRM|nr:TolC family protein [Selenomonadales bacterium 4137-cl]